MQQRGLYGKANLRNGDAIGTQLSMRHAATTRGVANKKSPAAISRQRLKASYEVYVPKQFVRPLGATRETRGPSTRQQTPKPKTSPLSVRPISGLIFGFGVCCRVLGSLVSLTALNGRMNWLGP